eukprot:TRINITY_DN20855_c0_g1_i2.p1 TRINITY_DN20855_c0_g1~~TRINITY_DN20855_c0_g1_i2.p1  ORF type:complete len:196 (-),score=47.84 TRINITY_DN20855_c0_g1_i2:48-548(-)
MRPERPLGLDLLAASLPAAGTLRAATEAEGFAVAGSILPLSLCEALLARLEAMFEGDFDSGAVPDKVPPRRDASVPAPKRPRVEQFVNAWKGDQLFEATVQSPALAAWVAEVAGWPEAGQVLQDQIWCKRPGSGPIAFHRDEAYMGEGVVTLWITLDDLAPELGPL